MASIAIPNWKDIRVHVVVFQTTLLILGIITGVIRHSIPYILLTVSLGVLIDGLIIRWKWKRWEIPFGALSASYGCLFFLRTFQLEFLIAAITLAMASKHLIRFNAKHVFNPSNFAITLLLVLFPEQITALGGRWGTAPLLVAVIIIFGLPILYRGRKLTLFFTVIISFLIIGASRALIFGGSPILNAFVAFATGSLLSFFFMITDPVTSPEKPRNQIVFGFSIVLIDQTLRYFSVADATQYALLLVCSLIPLVQLIKMWWTGEQPAPYVHWAVREGLVGKR